VGDINVYQLASTVKGLTLKEIMVHLERAGIEVMSFNTLVDEERISGSVAPNRPPRFRRNPRWCRRRAEFRRR